MGRWSGSITCQTAITQLEDAVGESGERPIVLKIPPGICTPEQMYDTTTAAIDHLKTYVGEVDIELHCLRKTHLEAKKCLDDCEAKLAEAKSELQEFEESELK